MKHFLLFLSTLLLLGVITYGQTYTGTEAAKRISGSDKVFYKDSRTMPQYISLDKNHTFPESRLVQWLQDQVKVSDDLSIRLTREQKDGSDQQHHRYQQTYHGVPVSDANFIVHLKDGKVHSINGLLYSNIQVANQVVLTAQQALVGALHAIPSEKYRWQVPGDGNASYYPKGTMVLFPEKSGDMIQHRYAWMFNVYSLSPLKRVDIYIDAQTGASLFENNRLMSSDTLGSALTKYSGTQDITTDYYNESFRLREVGRGGGIETYNLQQGTDYFSSVDFTDSDNYWNNVNALQDEVATDAHWGAEMTYDYYFVKHNRNSIDDQGFALKSYVHYDVDYANAFWDGEVMTYGDGDDTYNAFPALDICGHEITHGLTTFTADLVYSYESGALSEGYSDIFGTAIEFYAKPSLANWTCGEDIGETIRSLIDPNSMGDPDTYMGDNWATGGFDNGGVHTNCNVLGHWFYLLSVGGSGVNDIGNAYNVAAIGIDDAAKIAFRTLTVYLGPNSDYAEARFYSIQSAIDIFGACSPQMESTANAFYAVGVGPAFDPTVIADFSTIATAYCSLPAQVQFTNTSNNGVNCVWNFGDGTTSTDYSPTHTYVTEGVFTVSLFLDGGDCGADTTVKTDYISIDAPDNPVVTSASTCSGPASLTLTAFAADSVKWFTSPTGGTPFFTGYTYVTPVLSQTTHYFVESQILHIPFFGAKPNNSGGGDNYNWNTVQFEVFDAYSPFIIKSVKVYATGSGNRAISLRNSSGTALTTVNVNVPAGEQTITLNINVPAGTDWQLAGPPSANLYRNNNGLNYPYALGSLGSVKYSSATSTPLGRYYYFYNWEIEELPCSSMRMPVTAFINYGDPDAAYTYTSYPQYVIFQNTSVDGNDFLWSFGDGQQSTEMNPLHAYTTAGTYPVKLVVNNSCGSDSITQQVTVLADGIDDHNMQPVVTLSPVPASDYLDVNVKGRPLQQLTITVYDLLGSKIQEQQVGNVTENYTNRLNVSSLPQGVYLLEMQHLGGKICKRFVVK